MEEPDMTEFEAAQTDEPINNEWLDANWRADPLVQAKLRVLTEEWLAESPAPWDDETAGEFVYSQLEEREAHRRDLAAAQKQLELVKEQTYCQICGVTLTEGHLAQTVEQALRQFHQTYGLVMNDQPLNVNPDNSTEEVDELWKLRDNLHREEWSELQDAMEQGDLVDIADAICDLTYVIVGTAVSFGIPFDKCFAEVQRSNMSKLDEDGKPIVREDGKILKGPNFSMPDLRSIIYPDERNRSDYEAFGG